VLLSNAEITNSTIECHRISYFLTFLKNLVFIHVGFNLVSNRSQINFVLYFLHKYCYLKTITSILNTSKACTKALINLLFMI
jgi:hypothetical protein